MSDRLTGYPGNLTPEQVKVLNEFRGSLSRRFSSPTYDEIPLTLWGIQIPRRTAKGDLTNAQTAILLKFLRDARWSHNEAAARMAAALKWRVEYKIENLNKEKFSEELSKASYSYGVDRRGNPIIYTSYQNMEKVTLLNDTDKFVRWRISVLEKALASGDFENGGEKVTYVYDWYGCGLFLSGKISESEKKLRNFIRLYYPECTEYKINVNVSPLKEILTTIGNIFSGGGIKEVCVTTPLVRQKLIELISPDSIIQQYGGFDPCPAGYKSEVQMIVINAGKNYSSETPANKGDAILYNYVCREGDITGSYGFKKEGKRFLDDKNQIAKKESGKGTYEVEKKGAFVISFANEDPVGEKTVYFRTIVMNSEGTGGKIEKKKSKKEKKDKSAPSSPEKLTAPEIQVDEE